MDYLWEFYVAFWFYKKKKKRQFCCYKIEQNIHLMDKRKIDKLKIKMIRKNNYQIWSDCCFDFFKKSVKIKNYKLLLSNYNNKSNFYWCSINNPLIIIGSSNSNWKSKCCFTVVGSIWYKSDWWGTIRVYKILSSSSGC